jgi:hypothetical protein
MRGWILGLLFAAAPFSQADACTSISATLYFGKEAVTTLNVASGESCTRFTRPFTTARLTSLRVTSQPKHGVASFKDGVSPTYRSRPGFKGQDEYLYTVCGAKDTGSSGCSTVRVKVTVY